MHFWRMDEWSPPSVDSLAVLHGHLPPHAQGLRSHRALAPPAQQAVLDLLHCERFMDKAPPQVWAELLDGRDASIQTLSVEDVQADFGDVEPTAAWACESETPTGPAKYQAVLGVAAAVARRRDRPAEPIVAPAVGRADAEMHVAVKRPPKARNS